VARLGSIYECQQVRASGPLFLKPPRSGVIGIVPAEIAGVGFAENDIDFAILHDLTDQDLEKIGVASLGHRRKLLRAITELKGDETATPTLPPRTLHPATRVGVATGLVVVGDLIGSGASQEQAIVGETPNLAARLQSIAEPNSVVIAESTRKLLGNLFQLEDLGAQHLKGISGPVRAWTAIRPASVESRFDALHTSELTELVGRDEELELLMRRWSKAKSGEGQVALLSGEPGIGKVSAHCRAAGTPCSRAAYALALLLLTATLPCPAKFFDHFIIDCGH
jgi:hypothetical protein